MLCSSDGELHQPSDRLGQTDIAGFWLGGVTLDLGRMPLPVQGVMRRPYTGTAAGTASKAACCAVASDVEQSAVLRVCGSSEHSELGQCC